MPKIALFVFNADPVCFVHVLLNALDMQTRGYDPKIIIEGSATALIPRLAEPAHALQPLWQKAKTAGLVEGVCKACAGKAGTLTAAADQGLQLLAEMSGHPSMAHYREDGYEVITF